MVVLSPLGSAPAGAGADPCTLQTGPRTGSVVSGRLVAEQSPYRLGGVADRIGRCRIQNTPTIRPIWSRNRVCRFFSLHERVNRVDDRKIVSFAAHTGPKAGTSCSILPTSVPWQIRRGPGRITRGCRHQRPNCEAYGSVVPFPPGGVRATTLLSVLSVRHGSLESPRRKTLRVASTGQEKRWRSERNLASPSDAVKPDASCQRSRSRHDWLTKSPRDLRSTRRYRCTTFTMPIQEKRGRGWGVSGGGTWGSFWSRPPTTSPLGPPATPSPRDHASGSVDI